MARQIDWSKPLSVEDRAYLAQRMDAPSGQGGKSIRDMVEANDIEHGVEAKKARQTKQERIEELRALINDSQIEIERLTKEIADEANANVAVTGDPAQGVVVDNTGVDGQKPAGAPDPVETYTSNDWTVAALQTEIDKRNEERAEANLPALARTGTKSELVERLMGDDAEIAADAANAQA